jgi:hypothetical protein
MHNERKAQSYKYEIIAHVHGKNDFAVSKRVSKNLTGYVENFINHSYNQNILLYFFLYKYGNFSSDV